MDRRVASRRSHQLRKREEGGVRECLFDEKRKGKEKGVTFNGFVDVLESVGVKSASGCL